MRKLKAVLESMAGELPGFVASAAVLTGDGIPVATVCKAPEIDPEAVAAYLTSIVQSNDKAAKFLDGKPGAGDILVASDHYYLVRQDPAKSYFLFVVIRRSEWLGRVRLVLGKYEKSVAEILG